MPRSSQAEFTYIGILVAVVLIGLMLTAASRVWSVSEQRERETQLRTLVLAPGGGIMGVASSSKLTPIKRTRFTQIDASFDNTDCYCYWQFVYEPRYFGRSAPVNPRP